MLSKRFAKRFNCASLFSRSLNSCSDPESEMPESDREPSVLRALSKGLAFIPAFDFSAVEFES